MRRSADRWDAISRWQRRDSLSGEVLNGGGDGSKGGSLRDDVATRKRSAGIGC